MAGNSHVHDYNSTKMQLDFAMFLPGGKTEKGIEYVQE